MDPTYGEGPVNYTNDQYLRHINAVYQNYREVELKKIEENNEKQKLLDNYNTIVDQHQTTDKNISNKEKGNRNLINQGHIDAKNIDEENDEFHLSSRNEKLDSRPKIVDSIASNYKSPEIVEEDEIDLDMRNSNDFKYQKSSNLNEVNSYRDTLNAMQIDREFNKRDVASHDTLPKPKPHGLGNGRELQLIRIINGKFHLELETLKEIESHEGKTVFLTVIGERSSGRTYLINNLLGLNRGQMFKKNEGVSVWSVPYKNEAQKTNVFFLDTIGISLAEKSSNRDKQLLTLLLSISSFVIINTFSSQKNIISHNMKILTRMRSLMPFKSEEDPLAARQLEEFMPFLLFLQRDHKAGNPSIQEIFYHKGASEEDERFSSEIEAIFPKIDFQSVSSPFMLENDNAPPSFNKELKHIFDKILLFTAAKKFADIQITTGILIHFLKLQVSILNKGELIYTSDSILVILENMCIEAYNDSIEFYKNLFQSKLSEDNQRSTYEIYRTLKEVRTIIMELYENKLKDIISSSNPYYFNYLSKLLNFMDERESQAFAVNKEISARYVTEQKEMIDEEVEGLIKNSNLFTFEQLNSEISRIVKDRAELLPETLKTKVFIQRMTNTHEIMSTELFQFKKAIDEENANKRNFRQERENKKKLVLQKLNDEISEKDKEIGVLETTNSTLKKQMEDINKKIQTSKAEQVKNSEILKKMEFLREQTEKYNDEIQTQQAELDLLKNKKKGCFG